MREYLSHRTYRSRRRPEQKRKVRKGELVLVSEPFASIINNEHRLKYCDYCITSSKDKVLHPCRSCRVPWYCSRDCERLASDRHADECPHLKRVSPAVPPDFVRLIARIIFRLKAGGEKVVEKFSEKEGRRFKDLMSHYGDIKDNADCAEDLDFVIGELKDYIGEDNIPNHSDFLGIYGRIIVNRFCLLSNTMVSVGSAIYLAASVLDHSCTPTCSFYFSGRNVHIRSLVDVEDFNFERCRISYVDPVSSAISRREELYKKWFFWCDCNLCGDAERKSLETSMKCEECQSPVYVPEKEDPRYPTTPTCTRCGLAVDPVVERRYKDLFNFTKRKLHAMASDDPDIEMCVELLKRQDELFHPMNVWRVKTLDYTFNAAVFGGCWSLVYEFGAKNLEGMRYYYGSEHPVFALFLLKLGKAKIYLKLFREGLQHLEEAEPVLRRAYGSTHYLITEELCPLSLLANEDIEIALERRLRAWKKREEVEEAKRLEKKLQDFLEIGTRSGTQRFRGSLS
ncbi:histone-lysine N-methyltransferase SMYD3-like [Penaeus monodon]|uniref:histone-lysine N-methyltransferase SMYD3-like n=1 Tax=Penaeus monodon TaxID=6687 RepID=UPI0018A7A95E|nr:histone-lysine N-methyltransferase SMYD3-like [Penaeus monodon]